MSKAKRLQANYRFYLKKIFCGVFLATFFIASSAQAIQCVPYARQITGNSQIRGLARNVATNSTTPQVGGVVKTKESKSGHVAVITAIEGDYLILSEANYKKNVVTHGRKLSIHSKKIVGYINKSNESIESNEPKSIKFSDIYKPIPKPVVVENAQPITTFERGRNYSKEEIEAQIRWSAKRYFLNEEQMVRIAKCESGLNSEARSPSGKYLGIYQYAPKVWNNTLEGKSGKVREDPIANIDAAHRHMKYHGYAAWTCK